MDKVFITIVSACGLLLSGMCAYRYYTHINSSYVELICSVAFLLCAIIAFRARKWCK